jgi:hypothetical protein
MVKKAARETDVRGTSCAFARVASLRASALLNLQTVWRPFNEPNNTLLAQRKVKIGSWKTKRRENQNAPPWRVSAAEFGAGICLEVGSERVPPEEKITWEDDLVSSLRVKRAWSGCCQFCSARAARVASRLDQLTHSRAAGVGAASGTRLHCALSQLTPPLHQRHSPETYMMDWS